MIHLQAPAIPSAVRRAVVPAATTALMMATHACSQPVAPGEQSPTGHAEFLARTRCGADDEDNSIAPVLKGSALTSVQPLYSSVGGAKLGPQSELRGAAINVSALPGVSAEWLDRTLECHSAKATLGRIQTAPDDPFWLPQGYVDIDVRPTKDGFEIDVAGFSSEEARAILARANAWAASKAPAATSSK